MSCAVSFSDILMSIKLSMVAEAEDCPSGTYGLHLIANYCEGTRGLES